MKFFEDLGQRGLVAFLSGLILIVLYIVGVLSGRAPMELPVGPDGLEVTPEVILNLLAPVVILVFTIRHMLRSINTGVVTQAINPGQLGALLQMREFWLTVIVTVFAGLQMFNLKFWSDDQQATVADVLVNLIMTVITVLTGSYNLRPAGSTFESHIVSVNDVL